MDTLPFAAAALRLPTNSQSGRAARPGVGPRSATRAAAVAVISARDAARGARTWTLTLSPAARFDSATTVGTPCDQRRNWVLESTAKYWLSLCPTNFLSASLLPPFTSTYSDDELPASVSSRPLKMNVCTPLPRAANVLDAPAASNTNAARTTYMRRLLISRPPGLTKREDAKIVRALRQATIR